MPPVANPLLASALALAARGYRIVPLHDTAKQECSCQEWLREKGIERECPTPGKHPRFKGFAEKASTDPNQLRRWWAVWPHANVGIIAGKESGVWGLDTDPRNGGDDSRLLLVTQIGRLPYTMTTRTGGLGTHEYFLWPKDFDMPPAMSLGEDFPGLDIIGEGHVLVAPPSYHFTSGNTYQWEPELSPEEQPPVEAPAALLSLIKARLDQASATASAPAGQKSRDGFPLADIGKILTGCGWMRHCSDDAAQLGEPEWYAQLSILGRCENGDALAHDLSSPHPGYSAAATAAKLKHAVYDAGPVTCARVRHSLGGARYCNACEHSGKLKSPVVLGTRVSRREPLPWPAGEWLDQKPQTVANVRRVAGGQNSGENPAKPASTYQGVEEPALPVCDEPFDERAEAVERAAEVRSRVASAIEANDLDAALVLIPEIARLPQLEVLRIKTDLSTKFKRRFSPKGFEDAIRDERRRAIAPAGFRADDTGLPMIVVNNRPMRDVVADSLAALRAANDPPFMFVRSGEMVFVELDERQRPSIQGVEKAHLRGRMDRAANYVRVSSDATISVPPPVEVVEDILALPSAQWGMPPLEFVVEVPTLRPDGTILCAPGYDPISRMLYSPAPDFKMEPIPDVIDGAELERAVIMIDEAIYDFPFADKDPGSDAEYTDGNPNRANLFALLLTPIVRPAISGVVPMALIDAPQAGTGKSLLADLFSVITTGRTAAMMPFPRNEEEMQKSIGSTLLAGGALVCFDNIEGILSSPTLALVLTAKDYQVRILGVSENMIAPNRATWLATGNNIRPSGDMPRRCYHIRLDAKKSRPFQGRSFRHEDLLGWARDNRAELLRSLLIISRAWYQREVKPTITDSWGSFESWHKTIGGILKSASVDGFLSNLQKFLAEADDNALQWEGFLSEIEASYGFQWFSAGKIVLEIRNGTPVAPSPFTLPDSLGDVDRKKEGSLERALGKSFAKRLGTRFGERELYLDRAVDSHTKQAKWRVLTPATAADAKSASVAAPDNNVKTF